MTSQFDQVANIISNTTTPIGKGTIVIGSILTGVVGRTLEIKVGGLTVFTITPSVVGSIPLNFKANADVEIISTGAGGNDSILWMDV